MITHVDPLDIRTDGFDDATALVPGDDRQWCERLGRTWDNVGVANADTNDPY
jgi:hypothetical protein